MANMDKLMLWGALAVMAAVGSLSLWKISRIPAIDPAIVRLSDELAKKAQDRQIYDKPPQVPSVRIAFLETVNEPAPLGDPFLKPKMRADPKPVTPLPYPILPYPVPDDAKADLDGMTITWTLAERPVELKPYMIRKEAKPLGFIIERQCEDGQVQEIARVGPKERSYTDLSTEPRLTYRYWVLVIGDEAILTCYPPILEQRTKGLNLSAEARTPTATRMKLVGGDKGNGILRVETYGRAQKKWIGKWAAAVPGQVVGTTGWTLRALRFDNFTLVAVLTDDEGVERVLTTKD